MVRKTPSFRAIVTGLTFIEGHWVVETSRGQYVAVPELHDKLKRVKSGNTVGHTYQVSLNRNDQLRYLRWLYGPTI